MTTKAFFVSNNVATEEKHLSLKLHSFRDSPQAHTVQQPQHINLKACTVFDCTQKKKNIQI